MMGKKPELTITDDSGLTFSFEMEPGDFSLSGITTSVSQTDRIADLINAPAIHAGPATVPTFRFDGTCPCCGSAITLEGEMLVGWEGHLR